MTVHNLIFVKIYSWKESHLSKGYIDFIQLSPSFCKMLETESQIQV